MFAGFLGGRLLRGLHRLHGVKAEEGAPRQLPSPQADQAEGFTEEFRAEIPGEETPDPVNTITFEYDKLFWNLVCLRICKILHGTCFPAGS